MKNVMGKMRGMRTFFAWLAGILLVAAAPAAWSQSMPTMLDTTVTQVVAGNAHTCALTTAGAVQCWGYNADGELGNGTTTTNYVPAAVSGLSGGVAAIAAGDYHACALTTAGAVWCWGYNADGELGNGATTNSTVPVAVSGLSGGVAAIAAGGSHTCALTTAGAMRCWGSNNNGELGNGTTTKSTVPVAVSGLSSGVAAIAAGGEYHTCALTTAGAAQCWGNNGYGQLGNGTTTNSHVPVAVSGLSSGVATIAAGTDHTCAVTTAGAVQCWGYNHDGELGNGTTTNSAVPVTVSIGRIGATAITVGAYHTCALTASGLVRCWGLNNNGQLGNGTTTNSDVAVTVNGMTSGIAAIAAGEDHTCALTAAGGLRCWGWNQYGQIGNGWTANSSVPVTVRGLSDGVDAIAMGGDSYDYGVPYHACALTASGAVRCWGYNGDGELGNGTTTDSAVPVQVSGLSSGVAAIASGMDHNCALTTAGGVECWGNNGSGELGNGSTTNSTVPVAVGGLSSGVTAIATGVGESCALTTAGGVECWGNIYSLVDNHGQVTNVSSPAPIAIIGLSSGVAAIAATGAFTCVLTTAGTVQCWGDNEVGQLGNGTKTSSAVPVAVSGLSGVVAIAAELDSACALTAGGAVQCWGEQGSSGSVPAVVSGLSSGVAAIAAGNEHICALMTAAAGGGVKCWGLNSLGELGNGTSTNSNVPVAVVDSGGSPISDLAAAIFAGGENACALMKTSGALLCWGDNQNSQLLYPSSAGNEFAGPMMSGQSLAFAPGTSVSGQLLATVPPASTLTLSATATPNLGSVPITYDTWTPGTCTVSGSTLTITGVAGALCGVRASRAGDNVNPYGTTATASQQLRLLQIMPALASPTLTLATSGSPSVQNASVTFTATLASATNPAGNVYFCADATTTDATCDGGTLLCTIAASTSPIACATSALTVGTHAITAYFAGDGSNNAATTASALTQVVDAAPTITSANTTTFTVGMAGSFTVTTTGAPTPTLAENGALPNGVSFQDNGDGTGTLSGTPAAGTAGSYAIGFGASNGVGSPAAQPFTLTVNAPLVAPTIALAFNPASVAPNATTTLTVTLSNPNADGLQINSSVTIIGLPGGAAANVGNASASSTCSPPPIVVPANGSCTLVFSGIGGGNTAGSYTAIWPSDVQFVDVTDENNAVNTTTTSTATLVVGTLQLQAPTITLAFNPASIVVSATTTLSATLTNPNADGLQINSPDVTITGLPGGATANVGNASAGSTCSPPPIVIPANASCTLVFTAISGGNTAGSFPATWPTGVQFLDTTDNTTTVNTTTASMAMLIVTASGGGTGTAMAPTLSGWMLMLLGLLLMAVGIARRSLG